MEENIRKVSKMRISTYRDIAVKRGRVHRFSKWCAQKYKTSWRGIYESFRDSNTPPVENRRDGKLRQRVQTLAQGIITDVLEEVCQEPLRGVYG